MLEDDRDKDYICPVCGEHRPVPSLVETCKHKSLYQYTEKKK